MDKEAVGTLDSVFNLAEKYLDEEDIFASIQQWIREDQSGFLVNTLVQPNRSLTDILGALDHIKHLSDQGLELSEARKQSVQMALIRRLLSERDGYVQSAKKHIRDQRFP